jgi:hypothetical protein
MSFPKIIGACPLRNPPGLSTPARVGGTDTPPADLLLCMMTAAIDSRARQKTTPIQALKSNVFDTDLPPSD